MSFSKKIINYLEINAKVKKLKKEILDEIKRKSPEDIVEKIKKFEKYYKLSNIKISDEEILLEYYDDYEEFPHFVKINRCEVRL